MGIDSLTPAMARDFLKQAGLSVEPNTVQVEAREARWVVHLPSNRQSE